MPETGVVGILLAGGLSRRFGSDKLLHPLTDGTPIAIAAARKLRRACRHCVAVLRPAQKPLGELLAAEGLHVRYSGEAALGMGHSLAAAVRSAPAASGWLVALADMPFIAPTTISLLAYTLRGGASLAAPYYRGRRGHPVGFSGAWFETLSRLRGDCGARELLRQNAAALVQVPCDDPGILADVDTPAALAGLGRAPVANLQPPSASVEQLPPYTSAYFSRGLGVQA